MAVQTKKNWYAAGLRFKCTRCGNCCRGADGTVWLTLTEAEALGASLRLDLEAFAHKYLRRVDRRLALVDAPNGDCILLNEKGRCAAYAIRPAQCRTYPWWPEVLVNAAAWNREKRHCPGIGGKRLVPLASIQAQLEQSK